MSDNIGFLESVARTYCDKISSGVSSPTFVFPNRRAGLFLRKYLAQAAGRPIFSPKIKTISEVFEQFSTLKCADRIDLIFRLFDVYQKVYLQPNHLTESFDDFLFWGQMMLQDFTEIDRHLVDARLLYSNLSALKDIEERFSRLGENELEGVRSFAQSFAGESSSRYRQKFLSLWNCMYDIYSVFRSQLKSEGLAYAGMLEREVVEHLQVPTEGRFVFVGFYALTKAEESLMQQLHAAGCAVFHTEDEAEVYRRISDEERKIKLYRVASSTGQADVVGDILSSKTAEVSDWTSVAVLLPDERLLEPLLKRLPQDIDAVNVTMGRSLQTTPVYTLFQLLSQLQTRQTRQDEQLLYYYKPVLGLLKHPYVSAVSEHTDNLIALIEKNNMTYVREQFLCADDLLKMLFSSVQTSAQTVRRLQRIVCLLAGRSAQADECLWAALTVLKRLERLVQIHSNIVVQPKTFYNMFLQLLSSQSLPFEGEPLRGLQIMGMLESRALSFSTVIITDSQDDIFPGKPSQNSFIPYDMRIAYGMPTRERRDKVYAYNLFRLLSRAEEVIFVQNTTSDNDTSGELSRYVQQLKYQYKKDIDIIDVQLPVAIEGSSVVPLVVEKTQNVLDEVVARLCPAVGQEQRCGLSPSALNDYVACKLRFYFAHIRRLSDSDHIEETLADNYFGTILHEVMKLLYRPHTQVTEQTIKDMLYRLRHTDLVERVYADKFLRQKSDYHLEGKDYLPIRVIRRYVERILEYDLTLCPFRYVESERFYETRLTVDGRQVYLKGIIDRVDEAGGKTRIVDYKTGTEHSQFPEMNKLFDKDTAGSADHARQTLNYCLLYAANNTLSLPVETHIYYVRKPADKMDARIGEVDYRQISNDYEDVLKKLLSEIFSPDKPFVATDDKRQCRYCPFAFMCGEQ